MPYQIDLSDAKACLARARKHLAELRDLTNPGALWSISEAQDNETKEWFARLHLNRDRLVAAKPVLADGVTNAVSALDHVAAAIAKANGHERLRWLHYPMGLTTHEFKDACDKTKAVLGDVMLNVLANARRTHSAEVHHIEAAKQISNDGKHWEFRPAAGSAAAVQIVTHESEHRVFNLPANAFDASGEYEFYRGAEPLPRGQRTIVIKVVVEGLDEGLPKAATSILECSFRFVEGVITAVANAEP